MKLKLLIQSLSAAAFVLAAAGAQATVTSYASLASLSAASTATATDTFSDISITGSTPSPLVRTVGAYGYTATVSTTSFFGAGTTANPWLSTNTATDTITFASFTGGVSAIGGNFFDSDIAGAYALGGITITATDSFGASLTTTISAATTSSFAGFTTNGTFTSLTVAAVQPATPIWPTVDNLMLGQVAAVPEPETYALMLAGIAAVGVVARKRRSV